MKTSCSNFALLACLVHSATAFAPQQFSLAQRQSAMNMKNPFGKMLNFGEDKEAKAAEAAAAEAAAKAEEKRLAKLAAKSKSKLPSVDDLFSKLPTKDELLSKLPDFDGEIGDFDVSTVVENLTTTNGKALGERGEAFTAAQFFLIACIVGGGLPILGDGLSFVFGPLSLLGGIGLAGVSLVALGSDSLSPFPAATETSTIKKTGVYSELRHPMYSSLLLIMVGLSISTDSAARLLLTIVLGVLLDVKSEKEEEFLLQKFPDEYKEYQEQVPDKFIPNTVMSAIRDI